MVSYSYSASLALSKKLTLAATYIAAMPLLNIDMHYRISKQWSMSCHYANNRMPNPQMMGAQRNEGYMAHKYKTPAFNLDFAAYLDGSVMAFFEYAILSNMKASANITMSPFGKGPAASKFATGLGLTFDLARPTDLEVVEEDSAEFEYENL